MKLNDLIKEYNTFLFDLDETLWKCIDKNGHPIFAKQLIQPYYKQEEYIIDDVGSYCWLGNGVKEVLTFLKEKQCNIGFVSRGALYNSYFQPSLIILSLYDVSSFFEIKELHYKTASKPDIIQNYGKCVYFNDDLKENKEIEKLKDVKVINRYSFRSWTDLL